MGKSQNMPVSMPEILHSHRRKKERFIQSATTYTVFSLSPKEQKVTLRLGNQTLNAEDNPTYLGVTFDKRLTWKQHTQRTESRAKVRLALMKKLASTTWGADASTLKRLYTGRVRPVLEYGMAAWGTTAKTNMDKMSKVQNQAARIITGSMRSTPIQELETITGLQPPFWIAVTGSCSHRLPNSKGSAVIQWKKNESANERKTKEGKLCPPKQMSWTKTQRHPGTRPPKDFPVPWDPCLEQRKTFPCQKQHTRNRSQRFTEWSDEEIDHPGTPSTVLP